MITKDVKLMRTLIESKTSTNNQARRFTEITGKSRRTFFLYKKEVLALPERFCYFCNKYGWIIEHHINRNKEDNRPSNLVWLCNSCHSKIHTLMDELFGVKLH